MKYFTRERFLALQRPDQAEATDADWDDAVSRYEEHLQTIRPALPPAALDLLDGHHLHDARVLSLAQRGERLIVTLQLNTPPQDLLTAVYTLAGAPTFRQEPFPWTTGAAQPLWLYDELEVGAGHLTHSILLSNGWEIDVPFREVELTTARPIYPVPRGAPAGLPAGHAG
jgi:hypothetical protein